MWALRIDIVNIRKFVYLIKSSICSRLLNDSKRTLNFEMFVKYRTTRCIAMKWVSVRFKLKWANLLIAYAMSWRVIVISHCNELNIFWYNNISFFETWYSRSLCMLTCKEYDFMSVDIERQLIKSQSSTSFFMNKIWVSHIVRLERSLTILTFKYWETSLKFFIWKRFAICFFRIVMSSMLNFMIKKSST